MISKARPYCPEGLLDARKRWGLSVNLDHLSSARDWGIGDLTDLSNLIAWGSEQGAGFTIVRPLFDSEHPTFYDSIYIDVEGVNDFEESLPVQRRLLSPKFLDEVHTLRSSANIDRDAVRQIKLLALEHCYNHFIDRHLKKNTIRSAEFRAFQKRDRSWLRRYAVAKAYAEEHGDSSDLGTLELSKDFEIANYERVEFFEYIQWQIENQLEHIGSWCLSTGTPVGLCLTIGMDGWNKVQPEKFIHVLRKSMRYTGAVLIQNVDALVGEGRSFITEDLLWECLIKESKGAKCLPILEAAVNEKWLEPAKNLGFSIATSDSISVAGKADCLTSYPITKSDRTNLDQVMHDTVTRQAIDKMNGGEKELPSRYRQVLQATKVQFPRATYRFQFNKTFTFADAIALVPYLAELGVSHCYASPILQATPGSMHGYDVVNHNVINPEIGSAEELDSLVCALKEHSMGLIVDIVPNHMGIGNDNVWWNDVLENGAASIYSEYFDIDWQPVKKELNNKVLLPILGDFYGKVLHDGQLKIKFDCKNGSFFVQYFNHRVPLNIGTYTNILGKRLSLLSERLGSDSNDLSEYKSILDAFTHLEELSTAPEISANWSEKSKERKRLSVLCERNPLIKEFIEQNLNVFDVETKDVSAEQSLHELLEKQAYRLSSWRVSSNEINYRRFFDVNTLAAIRTEDARVFAETHHLIFNLIKERKIDGLRIDHPDGLLDPIRYFDELQRHAAMSLEIPFADIAGRGWFDAEEAPIYVVIEKILAPFEQLPSRWRVHGTVGYDFLNIILGIFVDGESEEKFDDIYTEFVGGYQDLDLIKIRCKDIILESVLASELNVLAHRLSQIAESRRLYRDFTLDSLHNALRQVVKRFPVYRSYVKDLPIDNASRNYIDWAVAAARKDSPVFHAPVYDFVHDILTLDILKSENAPTDDSTWESFAEAVQLFVMKFQQYTGPLMAKSVEDTMFYRYNRLVCLNEVGGDPERFGIRPSAFHFHNQQRLHKRPYEMITTSTHDTKRSEDMRVRLAVISETPELWANKVLLWQKLNKVHKHLHENQLAPDCNDEYLIYQTIVGILPLSWGVADHQPSAEEVNTLIERLKLFVIKAAREAKIHTSWINQDQSYEECLLSFITNILDPSKSSKFFDDLLSFHEHLKDFGLLNSLAQICLKFTSPGVPDIYMGSELWDFSMVDPDNRRPLDYRKRKELLDQLMAQKSPEDLAGLILNRNDGRLKLYVTALCLDYRKREPELFVKGKYIPLEITGAAEDHVIAFARIYARKMLITVVPLKMLKLFRRNESSELDKHFDFFPAIDQSIWKDTRILLPPAITDNLKNIFSDKEVVTKAGTIECAELFKNLPVAVLANF
jgi:malto-oligosyltrehalose synthase